jgi:hypothetical protein
MDSSYYIRSAKSSVSTDGTLSPVLLQTESEQYVCSVMQCNMVSAKVKLSIGEITPKSSRVR